jgi:hypothetical protein
MSGVSFHNTFFVFLAVTVIVAYFILRSNAQRSRLRPLVYGLFVFLLLFSRHNVNAVATNFQYSIGSGRSNTFMSLKTVDATMRLGIGEATGYLGVLLVLAPLSGDAIAGFTVGKLLSAIAVVLAGVGTGLLMWDPVNRDKGVIEQLVLQGLVAPACGIAILSVCGAWRSAIEAVYSSLFTYGLAGFWMISDLFSLRELYGTSTIVLIGAVLCIASTGIAVVSNMAQVVQHYSDSIVSLCL